jgi:hypothetical protein
MLAPILFLCLASSNISKGQFQKEGFHLLFPFPFATVHCKFSTHCTERFTAQRMSRTDFIVHRIYRAEDFVTQWDVVVHRMLRAWDFVAQWDVVAHRMLSRSGFRRAVGCCHRA